MKVTRHGGQLLVRSLSVVPGFKAKFSDRVTREEINTLRETMSRDPRVVRALGNRNDPAHAELRWVVDRLKYFAIEHPVDDQGDPTPWTSGRELPINHPIADMTLEEARERHDWVQTQPEFIAAQDPAHPQYADYRDAGLQLRERAHVGDPTVLDAPQPGSLEAGSPAAFEAKVAELRRDPAYLNAQDPHHLAAVEAVSRAYQGQYPEAGAKASATPAPGSPEAFRARIAELQRQPAYSDGRHPEHAAAVQAVSRAYEDAHGSGGALASDAGTASGEDAPP